MRQIQMLKTSTGAVKGIFVKTFLAGDICNVDGENIDADLADVFIRMEKAEEFAPKSAAVISDVEEKAITPAIENKMITPKLNNKGRK